jgi:hypothetical protein
MQYRAAAFVIVAALAFLNPEAGRAQPQPRTEAKNFSLQFFMERTGAFSPDIFTLEELAVHNGNYQAKTSEGGKFSGFLVRVEFHSLKETFAQGRQAQLVFRDRKSKKVLKTWTISDVYIGDNGVGYRARFFDDLDCQLMEATLTSGKTRITRELPFHCGE